MPNIVLVECEPCLVCGQAARITVAKDSYVLWAGGAYVQDAFPSMSSDERELLVSGTHKECWDVLFDS